MTDEDIKPDLLKALRHLEARISCGSTRGVFIVALGADKIDGVYTLLPGGSRRSMIAQTILALQRYAGLLSDDWADGSLEEGTELPSILQPVDDPEDS